MSQSNKGGEVPGDGDPIADATPPSRPRDDELVPDTVRKRPDPSDETQHPADRPRELGPNGTPVQPHASPATPPSSNTAQYFARNTGKRASALSVERTSLDSERILRDATRMDFEGGACPSLGGIPLLAKLGEGGMGTVYYGIHPRLNAEVAVKVLPHHLADRDPTLINRFVREAQIAAHVRSPHLVHVLDVNQDKGLYFLVMEYVCGLTGAKAVGALRRTGKTGLAQLDALDVCFAGAQGLKAAHERGVIHRDIKPDNIIIPYRLPSEDLCWAEAKLMDLGLARMQQNETTGLTVAESSMGTPGYMSPEQAMDAKSATQRSDIFSLGATLYGLLAGRSPFQRDSSMKTLFATVHEPCAPLGNFRDDLHPSVVALVERCLNKDPLQRFVTVEEFLSALRAARELARGGAVPALRPLPLKSGETNVITGGPKPEPDTHSTFIRTSSQVLREQARTRDLTTRKRAAILAAVGLCAVLLGATGYVVFRHPNPVMSAETRRIITAEHDKYTRRARSYADDGRFVEAGAALEMAARLGLDDNAVRQSELDAQKYVADAEKKWTQKYQQQLVAFDAIIESQALENAPAALDELKKYAPKDGSEEKTIAAKEQALKSLQELRAQEDSAARAMDDAAIMEPEAALASLKDIATKLDAERMKVSRARPDLERRLQELQRKKSASKDQLDKQRATEHQKEQFSALLADADKNLTLEGNFAAAEAKMNDAAKLFPADPELANRRERLEQLKQEKQRREQIAVGLQDASALIDKAAWDEAEAKLKQVEELSPHAPVPQVAELRQRSKDLQADILRKATEKEKREQSDALLAKVDALLSDGNLADAGKKLDAAVEIDAANPNLKGRQDRLAQRKAEQAQQMDTLVREAEGFLANDAQLAEAEKRIDAAGKLVPDDPRVKTLRDKFNEARIAAVNRERARQEKMKLEQEVNAVDASIPSADDPAAEQKLDSARTAFAALEAAHKGDADLDATRDKLAQRARDIQHVRFAGLVQHADSLVAQNPDAAEKELTVAAQMFPKDPLLDPVRQHISARREEIRRAQELENAFSNLDTALASGAGFAELNNRYNQLVRLSPDNPKLERYRTQILDRKRRFDFADLLRAANQQIRRDEFDDAEATLASAARLYPDDVNLADTRRQLAARRAEVTSRRQQAQATTTTTTTPEVTRRYDTPDGQRHYDSTKVGPNYDGGSVGEEKE